MAVAKIFSRQFPTQIEPSVADLFAWKSTTTVCLQRGYQLGNIWFVGAGSVGSTVAYFLALAGLKFDAMVFDNDIIKVHNLDRSPVFRASDEGKLKVEALVWYLNQFGIRGHSEPVWLNQSEIGKTRQQGSPDILVSAANERNVRYLIESQYPPVQVYGTTGQNWQACVFRHVAPQDPCTCCMFPPTASFQTQCATERVNKDTPSGDVEQVDAALPFLSFAAGLIRR
jgi:hypothetical protein